jgi:thioredoxin reductase
MTEQSSGPIYDVVIVGAGPAGLSAALVLARACRRIVIIDAGHPRNSAARHVNGFFTRDGISPEELRKAGRGDLAKYGMEVLLDTACEAHAVMKSAKQPFSTAFRIHTEKGRRLIGRKVLFATGMRDKLPDFEGIRESYGTSIHHCPYCDGWEHRAKHLLAYGPDPCEASGLGLILRGWTHEVTVLTNGNNLGADDRNRLDRNGIRYDQNRIIRFVHQSGQLEGVELESTGFLPAAAMFFYAAEKSRCDLARTLGVPCDDEFSGHTTRKQKTDVPGVFLAGDADGDIQFAIVAAAEGATAAVAINRELQDEDRA